MLAQREKDYIVHKQQKATRERVFDLSLWPVINKYEKQGHHNETSLSVCPSFHFADSLLIRPNPPRGMGTKTLPFNWDMFTWLCGQQRA